MPALGQALLRFIWVDVVALLLRLFGLSFRHNLGSVVVRRFQAHPRLSTEL